MRLRVLLAVVVLIAVPVTAQNTDLEGLAFGLQFNFGNPGARALGMGGAFIGAADDASAVEANPAGLTALTKTEVSIEGRKIDQSNAFPLGGVFPDITFGRARSETRFADPSFASVVVPVGDFRFAAYFHNPLQYLETRNAVTQLDPIGVLPPLVGGISFFVTREGRVVTEQECFDIMEQANDFFACLAYTTLPYVADNEISLKTGGLVAAWHRGNLSVGIGLRRHTFDERARTIRLDPNFNINAIATQRSSETAWTGSAGLKWSPSSSFSVGAVYKHGPSFDTTIELELPNEEEPGPFEFATTAFHTPDVFGVGISYRPFEAALLNVDVIRVTYSNLVDDFVSILITESSYEIKDGTEVHVGAEYFLPERLVNRFPVVVRVGAWRDPAHRLTYTGPLGGAGAEDAASNVAAASLFPEFDDETHKSIGLGLAYPRLQLDAAYDSSESTTTASLTLVMRF